MEEGITLSAIEIMILLIFPLLTVLIVVLRIEPGETLASIIFNNSIDDEVLKYMDDGAEIQFKEIIDLLKKMIGSRKIYISKKYIPYKNEIIKYLNENFTGEDLFE